MAWPSSLARTKDWGTETLTDADLEGQLDVIITYINAMMDSTTGHKHDGTTAEGPKILTANIDDSAGTAGDIYYSTGSAFTRLAIGTAGHFYKVNSGGTAPETAAIAGTDLPDGATVARTYVQTVAATTHATAIPIDDTAPPTNSEGSELSNLDLAHTAASSTNKLLIILNINGSFAAGQNTTFAVTLLKDTTVVAAAVDTSVNNGTSQNNTFVYELTPGDTSAHTYHFRIGNAAGSTYTLNGEAGSRIMGGVLVSSATAIEVKAS